MAKRIDWESIEPLFRAGNLSNYEICKQYNYDHKNSQVWKKTVSEPAIRKHAKQKGWKKDLAEKVQKQVRENVVRNQVRDAYQTGGASEQEIIEKAAEAGSNVIIRHQKEIAALVEHENQLLEELRDNAKKLYLANYQGEIIERKVELTVKEKSATLKDLASVRAQRIQLERQAHDLDRENANADSFEEFLRGLS